MQCNLINTQNNIAETFTIPQSIKTNTLPSTVSLIERGLGIGMLPEVFLKESIKHNRLVQLLPEVKCTAWPVYARHPYHGIVPHKIKSIIELAEHYLSHL